MIVKTEKSSMYLEFSIHIIQKSRFRLVNSNILEINKLRFFFVLFSDGEPIKLPESLESLPKSDHFPTQRHRWNTNEVCIIFKQ